MMFVIVRTGSGRKFARRIGRELKRINQRNKWIMPSVNFFPTSFQNRPWMHPRNTLIHSRAAYPDCYWVRNLVNLEERGFRVVNSTDVLRLTSDKLKCALKMVDAGLPHPKTWETRRSNPRENLVQEYINLHADGSPKLVVKPYTSMEQGANVKIVADPTSYADAVRGMPTSTVVVQEYVEYLAIYRVIVIGGRALPMSWVDRPSHDRWRVSVCLNRSMGFVYSPSTQLLRVAENTQRVIGGEVNFIDIFETRDGFVISEINTACNLLIHEDKARRWNHPNWNIARQIAAYLDRQARGMHGHTSV